MDSIRNTKIDEIDKILRKIYYDPENPASLGSVRKLVTAARKKHKWIKKHHVIEWLAGEDPHTLNVSVKRIFHRIPTYADHVDSVWQLDLADTRHLAQHNDGVKYLLIIIDVLSRFAFVVPMKTKEANMVIRSFETIREKYGRSPQVVVSDPGLEFRGKFSEYLKDNYIQQYLLRVKQKAPLAERFIGTLKKKMERYATYTDSERYIDVLGQLVKSYNYAIHSRIKRRPVDVNEKNEEDVKELLYSKYYDHVFPLPKFSVGDWVRQVIQLGPLDKGTRQTTTNEVFEIREIDYSRPPRILYKLTNMKGHYIKGRFYEEELVRVKKLPSPKDYMRTAEKRIKKTKRKTQIFKTYKGWPKLFDEKLEVVHKK